MSGRYFHSVRLLEDKCKGCTNCIKRCPTEAIRVRDGKAIIMENRCIDCGECIRICPNNAKVAVSDALDCLKNYKFNIALPAPAFYGQFDPKFKREQILHSLLELGFDYVFEVAFAAEAVAVAIKDFISRTPVRPLISQACPAVVGLIQVRFPSLIKNIIPVPSPVNVAARMAKEEISAKMGLSLHDIGCFFISPCPAKISSSRQPVGEGKNYLNGAFSMDYIYGECLKVIKNIEVNENKFGKASSVGISWGFSGGEMKSLECNSLAVDGIHNIVLALEAVENEELAGIDYLECQACTGGCVGGCLTPKNLYVAKANLLNTAAQSSNIANFSTRHDIDDMLNKGFFEIDSKINPRRIEPLDDDLSIAITKMEQLEKTLKGLPGLDCSSCGSPSCRALAEDIVRGLAMGTDCVFKLRERVAELAEEMFELSQKVPPVMGKTSWRKGKEGENK